MNQTNHSTESTAPRRRITPVGLLAVLGSLVVLGLLIAYFMVERQGLYDANFEWMRTVLNHWVP